jgi:crotonobetainyl-CoA:carnitine CoA-transferase CaiB-like acyl-CoA transferase
MTASVMSDNLSLRLMLALEDVTVLDLSHALAGPFASTLLGDYGADIIKIEPLEGEIARAWGPPFTAAKQRTSSTSIATRRASRST